MSNSNWFNYWNKSPLGYSSSANMRPEDYSYPKMVKFVHRKAMIRKDDSILDVGCGNGLFLKAASKYTTNLFGVDSSANLVSLAKSLLQKLKCNCEVQLADASSLPYPESTFDKVFCISVLEYQKTKKDAKAIISEMLRVCKPNGYIYLGDIPDSRVIKEEVEMLTFKPNEVSCGEKYILHHSYFESNRRFDIMIRRKEHHCCE